MNVLKFGASAVSSVAALSQLRTLIETRKQDTTVVVVSALAGVTDSLIEAAQLAAQGDKSYHDLYIQLHNQHMSLATAIDNDHLQSLLREQLDELSNIFKGIYLVHDLSEKTLAAVMSYGERLASCLVQGLLPQAQYIDARDVIKTQRQGNKNVVDFQVTNAAITATLKGDQTIYILAGFIASDVHTHEVTHLGRGGSDYTASIIAAALQADVLEIWTNVSGFMTADPAVIPTAYTIEHLTYVEAWELCNVGVNVIYPPSIYPVYHQNIPILIRNFHEPQAKGTRIDNFIDKRLDQDVKPIKGISSIPDTCLITVRGLGMVGVIGVNYRIFQALADSGISVFLVSQTASENNTSIAVKADLADRAAQVLRETFAQEIAIGEISEIAVQKGLVTIAIVGEQMRETPGVAGKLYDTLGRNGINVIASAQGASEMNISFVVRRTDLRKAIYLIHDSFFLSDYQVLNLFISGVGLVGKHLIAQIKQQQAHLMEKKQLRIQVVGLSNSKQILLNKEGIDLDHYEQLLQESTRPSSPSLIVQALEELNCINAAFIDCTASPQIADCYQALLARNIHVVAANKYAASSAYANYALLKRTARQKGVKFLFETNVGAGLPIINTINSLINSGDKILRIEAVVSGTLNYIFNVLSESVSMSQAIRMAQEAGYAEPDPRLDLNGSDVIRKLVILSREAGYAIDQRDVKKQLFIEDRFFEGDLDTFWHDIPAVDAAFEAKRQQMAARGMRLRFVASLEEGRAAVALQEVDQQHPFYELEGSNNVISLTTERYKDYPMVIKGYGAGAAVTAAGVFADIISIANIR